MNKLSGGDVDLFQWVNSTVSSYLAARDKRTDIRVIWKKALIGFQHIAVFLKTELLMVTIYRIPISNTLNKKLV